MVNWSRKPPNTAARPLTGTPRTSKHSHDTLKLLFRSHSPHMMMKDPTVDLTVRSVYFIEFT